MEPVECVKHKRKKEWCQVRIGATRWDCPDCLAGKAAAELVVRTQPLVRFSQTWGRDRPLTDKEKRFKPLKRDFR